MTERPRKLGDFKGFGHFEAKFWVEGLRFAPIYLHGGSLSVRVRYHGTT